MRPTPKKTQRKQPLYITYGLLWLMSALSLFLSLVSYCAGDATQNQLGLVGYLLGWCSTYLFGLASFLVPLFLGWVGWQMVRKRPPPFLLPKWVYFCTLLCALSLLLAVLADASPACAALFKRWLYADYYPRKAFYDPDKLRHYLGGVPLHHLYRDTALNIKGLVGSVGTVLLSSFLLLFSVILLFELPLSYFIHQGEALGRRLIAWLRPKPVSAVPVSVSAVGAAPPTKPAPSTLVRADPLKNSVRITLPAPAKRSTEEPPPPPRRVGSLEEYALPPASLLTEITPINPASLKNDLQQSATILEETLMSFGIEAKVGNIYCGPTVTSFEVHPAIGVKVQKIKTLESDIALNMQAKSIRIIAPIPGKAAVGIEVPNAQPQEVSFRELLESYLKSTKRAQIPLLLGKVVNGDPVWLDLAKMPHLIIAGATGSGKSVCINTIVMSIVMNARPDEIKIVMVDPKKVELTAFTHLPHMLAPVITEPGGAAAALGWLVKEMERRYEIFRQLGIRNIHGFNGRKINKELESSLDLDIPNNMPYIVVIIDELADLMMVSSSDIETPIARIAQMARAVGIHMILATQRPSREVITGLIKANFPCRIAFKVASRVNSQIIIDENGAETLLGNGDMLFMPPGTSSLVRAQGAFIRDEDINGVIHYVCSQAPTHYLIPSFDNYRAPSEEGENPALATNRDHLYEEAKSLVYETGNASTTFLQRKLKVGYARAASLMDQLEANGVIGPSEGAKPRKIYYPNEE